MPAVMCPSCRAENGPADVFCYKCSKRLEERQEMEAFAPFLCGILLIVAAILGFITWGAVLTIGKLVSIILPPLGHLLIACGILGVLLSLCAVVGGILALRANVRGIIIGVITGFFALGPLFISSILSFVVLVIFLLNRKDFYRNKG